MKQQALSLMKRWGRRLIDYMIDIEDEKVYTGIICPACHVIHGRMSDLIYPFMTLYKETHDATYLYAAEDTMIFCEHNLLRPDGSYVNDVGSTWKGITIFSAIAIGDTLIDCKDCLPPELYDDFLDIFERQAKFIYTFLDNSSANINYYAGAAAALALACKLTWNEDYLAKAAEFEDYCHRHFDSDGLFYGEIHGHDYLSPKGCHGIDMGYNLEESLPLLLKYAVITKDKEKLDFYKARLMDHLEFLLPDGAIDNSFGTRQNKWTYWGSRTSDGIIEGLALVLDEPVFAAACKRVLDLWENCTYDDLLSLPMAEDADEATCLHHTMCHIKALATLVNTPDADSRDTTAAIPTDKPEGIRLYQNGNVVKVSLWGWRATFSSTDIACYNGSENSGGSMTLLWHEDRGPVCASTMYRYNKSEPLNMQYLRNSDTSPCMTPHLLINGRNTVTDMDAVLSHEGNKVTAAGRDWKAEYEFTPDSVIITVSAENAEFVLPIICDRISEERRQKADVAVTSDGNLTIGDERIFNQVGGFEYTVANLKVNGCAKVVIKIAAASVR